MAKDAYYFTHDANARNDTKIILLRSKYGFEGYGRYWAIIEMMREADGYKLPVDDFLFPGLALSLSMSEQDVKLFISDCVRLLLFIMDDFLYSESLSERMEKLRELQRKKSEAGKKGADKRWQNHGSAIAVPKQDDSKPIASIHLSTHSSIQSSKKEKTLARPRNEDAPKEESILTFPCSGDKSEWHLYPSKEKEWQASFPGLIVLNECRKARQWIMDNPTKRKTHNGMTRFLGAWLGRVQNSGGSNAKSGNGRIVGGAEPTEGKYDDFG